MISQKHLNEITYEVIGASIEVHKIMGKGLLENVYHQCLKQELALRGINYRSELKIPVLYKDNEIQVDFKCDLFIENCLVVELKSIAAIHPT